MYPDDYFCHFYPPQILNGMDRQLTRAKDLAQSDEARARIELVEAEFRYLRSVASVYHMFRAYQVAPSWPLFDTVKEQVAQYQRTWDGLHPDGKAINPGGYRKLRTPFNIGWPCNSPLKKIGGPPFNSSPPFDWDFVRIRSSSDENHHETRRVRANHLRCSGVRTGRGLYRGWPGRTKRARMSPVSFG
jgi:hypothetical protein